MIIHFSVVIDDIERISIDDQLRSIALDEMAKIPKSYHY